MIITPSPVALATAKAVAKPAIAFLAQKAVVATACSSCAAPALAATGIASLTPAVLALRGGGGDAFDMGRAKTRLEGLASYGVVTALMMNAALRLYSATPKKLKPGPEERLDNAAKVVFAIVVGLSVVAGAYTSVVFQLLGLYSKSALGLGMDDAYMAFFEETAFFRKSAFQSFILTLVTMKASFILSVFLNYEGKLRWASAGTALVASIWSWCHWSRIMHIAGKLLFPA